MTRKAFTVEQANALVAALTRVFREIDAHKARIHESASKIDVLELLWGSALRDPSNPDHAEFASHRELIDQALQSIERTVEQGILARGLRLPAGGIEEGLVDFPTTYQGRWVYLCWHAGEREVRHWHETDAGFAGRQEITDAQRRQMGSEDPDTIDDSELDF